MNNIAVGKNTILLKTEQISDDRNIIEKAFSLASKKLFLTDTKKIIQDTLLCNLYDKRRGNAFLIKNTKFHELSNSYDSFDFSRLNVAIVDGKKRGVLKQAFDLNIKNCLEACSPMVLEILYEAEGKISLCGGSIVDLVDGHRVNDYDLFFHCSTVKEADELLTKLLKIIDLQDKGIPCSRSQGAISVEDIDGNKIQFIMRNYESKDQILLGFDLPPCKAGWNPKNGFFMTLDCAISWLTGGFPFDGTQRSLSHSYRLHKYVHDKGFNLFLPGLDFQKNHKDNMYFDTPDGRFVVKKTKLSQ